MSQPFMHPKSGIHCIRRKVPDDLRASFGREFKRSLKTQDAAEARANFAAAWLASEQKFALARAQTKGTESLGPQDVRQLAAPL